jgi:hypothetical protein
LLRYYYLTSLPLKEYENNPNTVFDIIKETNAKLREILEIRFSKVIGPR